MKNKILIYDDNCPLCCWYSNLFVKYGLLEAEGRKPFSAIDHTLFGSLDVSRGRNEIPLVDTQTGHVLYGVDALLEIIGKRYPLLKKIGWAKPVYWITKKFYKFISYNRKVIVAKKCGHGQFDCAPEMNYFHRLLFLFVFLLFNTLMLIPVHNIILSRLPYYNISLTQLQLGHFIFVCINCILALSVQKQKIMEYLGQVNMLALTAILLLMPLLLLSLLNVKSWVITGWLIGIAVIVFKEYFRRMEYASILPSDKWIASINLACMVGFILFLFN